VRNFGRLNWVQFFVVPPTRPGVTPAVTVGRLFMRRFENAVDGEESLLAEGIEDMQISYACDVLLPLPPTATDETPTNPGDGRLTEGWLVPDDSTDPLPPAGPAPPPPTVPPDTAPSNIPGRTNDEWIFNTRNDTIRPDCHHPAAVRITLVARSLAEDLSLPDPSWPGVAPNYKPSVEDGKAGPADRYRHRVITTTITLRNRE
jgi:hypothetical protein